MNQQTASQDFLKKADKKLDEIANELFRDSQENIVKKGVIDEGTLLKSGNINRKFLEKEIVYSAPHAKWIEYGTEPHFPPIAPLEAWAKRKLGLNDKEAKSAAFGIANKINEEGSEPKPFLREAVNQIKRKYGVRSA